MMRFVSLGLLLSFMLIGLASPVGATDQPTQFVDPFIGTAAAKSSDYSGNTYPGAQVPWGMVSISPQTRFHYPGGYVKGDPYLYGFGQNHRSGGGCGDLGNFVVMPTVGSVKTDREDNRSAYADELAQPGLYQTQLSPSNLAIETSATVHASILRLTTPQGELPTNLLIDVSQNLEDKPQLSSVHVVSPTEIEGTTLTGSHCGSTNEQPVYFVAQIDQPSRQAGTWIDQRVTTDSDQKGNHIGGYFSFAPTTQPQKIVLKLGVSYTSLANARANLLAEIPDFDFKRVRTAATNRWNDVLNTIETTGGTTDQQTIFRTGLYHMLLQPNVLSDVNGDYPTPNGTIASDHTFTHYTVFPTWDQFRTVYPLLALVYPSEFQDMVRSVVSLTKETGWLPKWELLNHDTRSLTGDHAAVMLAMAYLKGIKGFDSQSAYSAMVKSATDPASPNRPGLKEYLQFGYIPEPTAGVYGSVSTTLEYSYDDWAISQLATALGKTKDAQTFLTRSMNYQHLFDPQTGFFRPKRSDGTWFEPFNPNDPNQFPGPPGFVEGNAWDYTFFPSQDQAQGLLGIYGQDELFAKLDQAFRDHHLSLNNEPDTNFAYLFNYLPGKAWRTQAQVQTDLQSKFSTKADGLPGNDDEGALSGIAVFDMLGFFPVDPVMPRYELTTPIFDRVTIHLDQHFDPGQTWQIQTSRTSPASRYISTVTVNGQPTRCSNLTHPTIVAGGLMRIDVVNQPTTWGSNCQQSSNKNATSIKIFVLVTCLFGVLVLFAIRRFQSLSK